MAIELLVANQTESLVSKVEFVISKHLNRFLISGNIFGFIVS